MASSVGGVPELLNRPSAGRAGSLPLLGRDGVPTLFD
jgi:hypothetical protein